MSKIKGVIFTEFLQFVEEKFGLEVVDTLIQKSVIPSNGVYTAVGRYNFSELQILFHTLSSLTKLSIDDLQLLFSNHSFNVLVESHPNITHKYNDPLELLSSIEKLFSIEVLKIYPDFELSKFKVIEKTETLLSIIYSSNKSMYMFVLGLLRNTLEFYDTDASIEMEKIKEDGSQIKFIIVKDE